MGGNQSVFKSTNAPNNPPSKNLMPNVFKVSPNVPKNSVIPNVLKLSNSSKNSGLMSGLLSGLGEGLGILEKSGPYNQVESEGMLGKEYSIPTVNPVDQSYMPKCAQGRCVRPRKITNSDGTTREECDKYGEPRQIPESDMFDSKERHSCGYDSNPVEMFSNAKPTYSVYWKPGTKPKAGGTRRNNIKNVRKTRRNKHKN